MTEKPHSKLGIASIIIGFVIIVIGVLWYLTARLFFEEMFGTGPASSFVNFSIASLVVAIIFAMLHLVGMGFGISGWISRQTKNLFPIIGTFFNLLLIIGNILLIIWWGFIFAVSQVPAH